LVQRDVGGISPLTGRGPPSQTVYIDTPLEDAEVNQGLVRFRRRVESGPTHPTVAQLIPTSDSQPEAVPG